MKMYVLVRNDLNAKYSIVQGSHAVVEYSLRGDPISFQNWNNGTIVYLGVRNEKSLLIWYDKLTSKGKNFTSWREPDLGNQMSAIACVDSGEIFEKLNLA